MGDTFANLKTFATEVARRFLRLPNLGIKLVHTTNEGSLVLKMHSNIIVGKYYKLMLKRNIFYFNGER